MFSVPHSVSHLVHPQFEVRTAGTPRSNLTEKPSPVNFHVCDFRAEVEVNGWLVNTLLEPISGPDHFTEFDHWLHSSLVTAGDGGGFNRM